MHAIRLLVLGALALAMPGCAELLLLGAGSAAGVAGYHYYDGALVVTYEAPLEKTWDATLKALKEIEGVRISGSEHGLTEGKITGEVSDNRSLRISLSYVSSRATEVQIRVGYLGDQGYSEMIKERIRKKLVEE